MDAKVEMKGPGGEGEGRILGGGGEKIVMWEMHRGWVGY